MYRYNYVEEGGKLHVFAHPLHRLMAQVIDGLIIGSGFYVLFYVLANIFMPEWDADPDLVQMYA